MKLSLSHGRLHSLRRLLSSSSAAAAQKGSPKKEVSDRHRLYSRIAPVGNPKVSVVPILDQWVSEGNSVNRTEVRSIIKELSSFNRFTHALEISEWMSDKRYIPLQPSDIVSRLNLIQRVRGIEQAESYFNTIPQNFRGFAVYTALLSCYARENSVEKAESVMQILRKLELDKSATSYNILMNVYYRMKDWEKIDALMSEMKEKGISHDKYTLSIRLSAYVSASDVEGVDKIMKIMESDKKVVMGCDVYSVAADGYLKLGHVAKAMTYCKKLEKLIMSSKNPAIAFNSLIRLYMKAGNKDELYRFWNIYKEKYKVYNKGYIVMMSSVLKFNDIELAEKIFEEWESKGLSYDFCVPNFLVDFYCRNGFLDKANSLIEKGISSKGTPTVETWCYLANGYLEKDQEAKAVEALVKGISVDTHKLGSKAMKEKLVTCLEYLEGKGDLDRVDEFISSLRAKGVFSESVLEKLMKYINGNAISKSSEAQQVCVHE